MKFFIPHAKDDAERDSVYNGIFKFAQETTWKDIIEKKIFAIDYKHEGKDYHAEVGKIEDVEDEEVIAILESEAYLVCTKNRGVVRGMPMLVGKDEIKSISLFEKE